MTIETWKEEFIPVSAEEQAERYESGEITLVQVIEYGLLKWEGVKKENLEKHGVKMEDEFIVEFDEFDEFDEFSLANCGLCDIYYKSCSGCVGFKANGKRCDIGTCSPWTAALMDHNLKPMFEWLNEALEYQKTLEN